MTRDELVFGALNMLHRYKRLICQWATGVGKSRIALEFLRQHPQAKCLILVPETDNIKNWKEEFDKFGVSYENTTIVCYASFHKFENTTWDLVVYDEAPHLDTEKKRKICETVNGEYILALGAVITMDEQDVLRKRYGQFANTIVSLETAIKNNLLPSPEVIICHMTLDDTRHVFFKNGKAYTAKEMYALIENDVNVYRDRYADKQNELTRMRMLRAGNERKRFLGARKDEVIKQICDVLEKNNKRFLCFCASISQANKIGKDNAFTSKTPASMKLLDKFNDKQINSLYVVGKLIEGQNLNDIHCGVLGQIGGTARITIQSIGRIMRSENPVIYVPIFDDTKDTSFLYNITSSIPANYIKHCKLSEIN